MWRILNQKLVSWGCTITKDTNSYKHTDKKLADESFTDNQRDSVNLKKWNVRLSEESVKKK